MSQAKWSIPVGGRPYEFYRSMLFARTGAILLALGAFEMLVWRRPQIFAVTFRSIKFDADALRIFGIVTSGGPRDEIIPGMSRRILSAYAWVVRVILVLAVCYIWDFIEQPSSYLSLKDDFMRNQLTLICATGWDCFSRHPGVSGEALKVKSFTSFWSQAVVWDLDSICADFLKSDGASFPVRDDLSEREHAVSCYTFSQSNMSGRQYSLVFELIGISFGCFLAIVAIFEGVTWLLLRTRRGINTRMSIDLIILLSIALTAVSVAEEAVNSITASALRSAPLAIPILLIQCRRVSRSLIQLRQHRDSTRAEKLQRTDFGLELAQTLSFHSSSTSPSPPESRKDKLIRRGKGLKQKLFKE